MQASKNKSQKPQMDHSLQLLSILLSFFCALSAPLAFANDKPSNGDTSECAAQLNKEKASAKKASVQEEKSGAYGLVSNTETSDQVFQATMETYTLEDLVNSDPEKNLAVQHPFIVMSAAQRLYSVVMSEGTKVEDLRGKGKVTIYNLFSNPSEVNKGKVIVGQEKEIASVVDALREAIRGSVKVPFLVGPHGTGKTLFQDIFRAALWYKTLNDKKKYYLSFEWKGLDEIPGTAGVFPGGKYRAPLHDSPVTLLPSETQKRVITFSQENNRDIHDVVGDFAPSNSLPDPHSYRIREKILDYYTEQKGEKLTEKEIIESLRKHVVVKREVLGSNGTAPVMDAQGRDYTQGDLFISKDPLNSNTVEGRLNNPWSWNYGMVPNANGSVMFLDEFPRNPKTLRDIFLRVFESHEVSLSGQTIPFDSFIIAAGNFESLNDMSEGEGSAAQADRLSPINYVWSIEPHEIAKTLLYMYGDVYARDLKDADSEIEKADLQKLFPRTPAGAKILGSDGRYELWFGSGSQRVHVSPHALMLVANIASATRLHIKGAEAIAKEANFTANTTVYNHPVERVKYLNGRLDLGEVTPQELDQFSVLMEEGHFGLSSRDAAEWLREATNEARKQEKELTPKIVLDVFHEMVDGKRKKVALFSKIFKDKEETRKMWHLYANLMAEQILLPDLRTDLFASLAQGDELINRTFDVVVREIIAVGAGKSEFNPPNGGAPKQVDKKRLTEIEELYLELHKTNLDKSQLATMYMMMVDQVASGHPPQRDTNLIEAIQAYYARQATETMGLNSLVHYSSTGEGGARVGEAYNNLVNSMKTMGWSEVGLRQALALVEVLESRIAQAKLKEAGVK